jgi:hypothetical protein
MGTRLQENGLPIKIRAATLETKGQFKAVPGAVYSNLPDSGLPSAHKIVSWSHLLGMGRKTNGLNLNEERAAPEPGSVSHPNIQYRCGEVTCCHRPQKSAYLKI